MAVMAVPFAGTTTQAVRLQYRIRCLAPAGRLWQTHGSRQAQPAGRRHQDSLTGKHPRRGAFPTSSGARPSCCSGCAACLWLQGRAPHTRVLAAEAAGDGAGGAATTGMLVVIVWVSDAAPGAGQPLPWRLQCS